MFTNNTKETMFFSADNLMCRYDEEITDAATIEDAADILPPTSLNAGISTIGNIYFFVPNGTKDIRIECTTEQGIAIFPFTIKDN